MQWGGSRRFRRPTGGAVRAAGRDREGRGGGRPQRRPGCRDGEVAAATTSETGSLQQRNSRWPQADLEHAAGRPLELRGGSWDAGSPELEVGVRRKQMASHGPDVDDPGDSRGRPRR